ncbi:MAG: 16S rRNA (cytosine(1402)-N(4))-methyltransferase RsmH [Firmicutes bacterium]|nr:16S rRNA (cytosine(1402)-N(4))-methyltransferase RsmH [Candidatus Fiminaster equi]
MSKHISVLLNETIDGLDVKPNGTYVDLTLGRGGHSKEILKKLDNGLLVAFDKDETAINESRQNLHGFEGNFTLILDDFRNFKKHLNQMGIDEVDGLMADLGVSSPQFDDPSRGFSYKEDARLDMRMDTRQKLSAYEVINTYSLNDLTRIFREYGEDKYSYQIANKIVKMREISPIETTTQLVDIIKASKPQKELMKKGHPAKQIFQAIRIEVNDELGALKDALTDALKSLKIGGRAAFITFHSLEDRLVKNAFNEVSKVEGTRHNVFSLPTEDDLPNYRLVNNKVIIPSEKEMEENPRSKSAKLRIIERVK